MWYLALAILEEDEEVQKAGVIEVFFANGAFDNKAKITDYSTKGTASLLSLPIRLAGMHFCYSNPAPQPIIRILQMAFGAVNRLRFRAHYGRWICRAFALLMLLLIDYIMFLIVPDHVGSSLEVQYELMPYGIVLPTELFQRDVAFKQQLIETFLQRRRAMDAKYRSQSRKPPGDIILHPDPYDVLLGKGRSCQEFGGNQEMNRMIDDRYNEYRQLDKSGKAGIANLLLQEIHDKGGFFLERVDNVGWKIVSDETTCRNKITQAFRARNRGSNPYGASITSVSSTNNIDATEPERSKKARHGKE